MPTRKAIYIVDDNLAMRVLLAEIIDTWPDYVVAGNSASARDALDQIPRLDPMLAIIDVAMPGMNGIDLVRQLTWEQPVLPCILYSACRREDWGGEVEGCGARDYVENGAPEALYRAMERVLGEA